MKHTIKTIHFDEFSKLWVELLSRLEQTGEKIAKAKFSFNALGYYRATVWTAREKGTSLAEIVPAVLPCTGDAPAGGEALWRAYLEEANCDMDKHENADFIKWLCARAAKGGGHAGA